MKWLIGGGIALVVLWYFSRQASAAGAGAPPPPAYGPDRGATDGSAGVSETFDPHPSSAPAAPVVIVPFMDIFGGQNAEFSRAQATRSTLLTRGKL